MVRILCYVFVFLAVIVFNATAGEMKYFKSPALERWFDTVETTNEDGCTYNEIENRIEIGKGISKLSPVRRAECLAEALVQARYGEIEASWLKHLGENEAWIVRTGVLTKVSATDSLQEPAARALWVSFATRELMARYYRQVGPGERVQTREIAQAVERQASEEAKRPLAVAAHGHNDPIVSQLLELEN